MVKKADAPKRPKRPKTKDADKPAKFDAVCQRIATSSDGMRVICAADGMLSVDAFRKMIADEGGYGKFTAKYQAAKEAQADHIFTETLEIADDGSNDYMKREHGGYQLNAEHVQRSKLRIETRKWQVARLNPTKYGEKQTIDLNHGVKAMDDRELEAHARALAEKLGILLPAKLIDDGKS